MSLSRTTLDLRELELCWKKWAHTVSRFAERRKGWAAVDPIEYEANYRRLVDGCETIARADPAPAGLDPRKVAQVVRPWLTVGSLANADRELLQELIRRSSEIDGRDRQGWVAIRALASRMIVVGSVAAGVALLAARPKLPSVSPQFWMTIELNLPQLIAALILLGSIWAVVQVK